MKGFVWSCRCRARKEQAAASNCAGGKRDRLAPRVPILLFGRQIAAAFTQSAPAFTLSRNVQLLSLDVVVMNNLESEQPSTRMYDGCDHLSVGQAVQGVKVLLHVFAQNADSSGISIAECTPMLLQDDCPLMVSQASTHCIGGQARCQACKRHARWYWSKSALRIVIPSFARACWQ